MSTSRRRFINVFRCVSTTAAAIVMLSWQMGASAFAADNTCISCHASQVRPRLRKPATTIKDDVHYARGLSCQDCHGGDPTRKSIAGAHSRKKGFVGAPKIVDIPEFCARCHSDVEFMKKYNPKLRVDQLQEYWTSKHGKLLAKGDERVATCVSCHGVHGILSVSDTRSPVHKTNVPKTCAECHANANYMKPYDIPTNQYELYKSSVHGRKLLVDGDLGAPACNSCHGNHGATPPGLISATNACGECHANNRDYFDQSPHNAAFAEMGIQTCITCHSNHDIVKPTDQMVGVTADAVCMNCHSEGDAGYATAAYVARGLDSLKTTLKHARSLLSRAEQGGINVSLGTFDLKSADDALIKARTAVHYFDSSKFNAVLAPGLADADRVIEQGEKALWRLRRRQIGLSFAIPIILWVALALYLRIRRYEREHPYA